jgi:hypothetical protein
VNTEELIQTFPTRRISPFEGMAITAEVWADAHEYHRQSQQLYALFSQGPGILVGLQVIASDPPDSSLYILPGIALDSVGRTIVVTEPVAYDLAGTHGLLHLLLTYGESQPQMEAGQEGGPQYVQGEFAVQARPDLPESACVELARIRREDRDTPIMDARNAEHPALDEIDLRYRQETGAVSRDIATIAVCYAGKENHAQHGRGADHLARALRQAGHRIWLDDNVPLSPGLAPYMLIYLVGQGTFQLGRDEMTALYTYIQGGGTVFIESCRRDVNAGNPPADVAFAELLTSLGIRPGALPPEHRLLAEPFFFATPPPGYETQGTPRLVASDGVILSTFDYGCLWNGERRGRAASREEIRSALEWGSNIVAYAAGRHLLARAGKRMP